MNARQITQFLLVLLMVAMHGAVYWSANFQESYVALFAVAIFDLGVAATYLGGIPKWFFAFCVATAACYFLSAIMNGIGLSSGLNIKTALILDINVLTVWVAYMLDRNRALNLFVIIITVLAAISLAFYFITLLVGKDAVSVLFTYCSWGRGHYVNLFYSFSSNDRNCGIFYEPGIYQIVLNSALYILLFARESIQLNDKMYNLSMAVLAVTVITSGSTTGYLNLAFILVGMMLMKRKSEIEKRIAHICGIFLLVIAIDYVANGDNSLVSTYVLNKLSEMQLTASTVNYDTSGGARLFIFQLAKEALVKSPFFGLGSNYVSEAIATRFWRGFGTGNGLCSMVASKGLVTTAITIVPFLYMAYINRSSGMQYLIFILIYFNTVFAQSPFIILCCSFVLICMYEFYGAAEEPAELEEYPGLPIGGYYS